MDKKQSQDKNNHNQSNFTELHILKTDTMDLSSASTNNK